MHARSGNGSVNVSFKLMLSHAENRVDITAKAFYAIHRPCFSMNSKTHVERSSIA